MTHTKNILISQRYSEALSELAKDGKLGYDKINADLKTIKEALSLSKDLNDFLINPLVSIDDKKEVISTIFSKEIDSLMLNFLNILIDKNRFDAIQEIITSFDLTLDKINNISRVQVTSAVVMSEDAKKRLVEKLSSKLGKNVVIENSIDENIIAGLVIRIGDNIIDTSLRNKLDELEKNITK